jgi:3-oxoacyl-[acyl-carrier-protein] synthase-1/3-oxoacyl-[acyl-carrier-protein] synthase II
MRRALADAGVDPAGVSYVNLHGTGTPDNDAAEARALEQVFGETLPPLSSIKGLTGHTLAAAGGLEAVVSVIAVDEGLLPANTGLETIDPGLHVSPLVEPTLATVDAVLSNAFGFGGNNAALVIARARATVTAAPSAGARPVALPVLRIASVACLSGRGGLPETLLALEAGESATGLVPDGAFANAAPAAFVRRLRRLPRLVLALATSAQSGAGALSPPAHLAVGTAWGPLAETWEFLRKLFESNDQFSSPMDFIGSVNNAPAGQVALLLGARSPNLTFSSGDSSFEQAVLSASLAIAAGAGNALVLGAEAYEPTLSPRLDAEAAGTPCDGGAGFVLVPDDGLPGARLRWLGETTGETPGDGPSSSVLASIDRLDRLAGLASSDDRGRFDAVALGIPASHARSAQALVAQVARAFPACAILPYRDRLGQHASVSATATAVAAHGVVTGALPWADGRLARRRVLLLQLGHRSSALEVFA